MKKKVIGTSILLLVLLLGLSTTCYALSWETVRDKLNNYTGNNIGVARFKLVLNNTTQYNKLVNNWDISGYDTIIYQSMETSTNDYANDRLIICNNNGKIYKQNNEQIVRSIGNFDCLNSKIYSINQNVAQLMYVYESITSSFYLVNGSYNRNFILTNGEIYNSSNLNSPATSIEVITYNNVSLNFDYPQTLISRSYTTNIKFYAVGVESNTPIDKLELIDENGYIFGGIQDFRTIYEEENNYSYQLWLYSKNAPSQFKKYKAVAYYNNIELGETGYTLQIRYIADGTIQNSSGDTTGTINLDGTNQRLDEINNTLKEQQETTNIITGQESGEKAQTFWENVYNNLFTMESGEVQEIIDNFVENTNLEELGTLEIEEQILNILNDEPRRFHYIMGKYSNTKFCR